MFLYLVQHGESKSEEEDAARPLSGQGARDVSKAAFFAIKNKAVSVDGIFHSGKLRAEQTAELLVEYVQSRTGISKTDGLSPMDDPMIWAGRLKGMDKDVMLVGHLPHLGGLASALLCGAPDAGAVSFKMGGIVCLKREEGRWSLQWAVVPDLIPGQL